MIRRNPLKHQASCGTLGHTKSHMEAGAQTERARLEAFALTRAGEMMTAAFGDESASSMSLLPPIEVRAALGTALYTSTSISSADLHRSR